jgi:hypothetical protein
MKMNPHFLDTLALQLRPARIISSHVKRTVLGSLITLFSLTVVATVSAVIDHPENLGNGLDQVVARELAAKAGKPTTAPGTGSAVDPGDRAIHDGRGRLLVTVYLKQPTARVAVASVKDIEIKAADMSYQGGAMDVYVPAERVNELATTAGVSSVFLALTPVSNVGAVTSQGVHQHRVDQITNQDVIPVTGITGKGITVGVLSNSFNTSGNPIDEEADIASGDLPGPGNPNNSTPVLVLEDDLFGSIDEGRAMCQIVHDMAPAANLAYATGDAGEVSFADNIRRLADPVSEGGAGADVIVDDLTYYTEGMFQDTIVARAVDDVVALGVSYFSSAGNEGPTNGYYSDFRLVPNDSHATDGTNINLTGVPPELYAGGFHNFNPAPGQQDIAQTLFIGGFSGTSAALFDFQWDDAYDVNPVTVGPPFVKGRGTVPPGGTFDFTFDGTTNERVQIQVFGDPVGPPFDPIVELIAPDGSTVLTQDTGRDETLLIFPPQTGTYTVRVTQFGQQTGGNIDYAVAEASGVQLVTTDFNMLFFKPDGTFIGALGEKNIVTNRPVEIAQVTPSQTTENLLQVVIARSNTPPPSPQPATKLRYVTFSFAAEVQEYFSFRTPITFGHNAAAGGNGVTSYNFFPPFTPLGSPGPLVIAFDKDNNRLAQPEIRKQPDMAAMSGANTTFFFLDSNEDTDTFPNFFGTSAAAPHAAAIAALVLEVHGGPGSVTPDQMRSVLQRSAFPHDLDPYSAQGRARSGNSRITINIQSDDSAIPGSVNLTNPNAFQVRFVGSGSLTQLILNPQGTDATGGDTTEPIDNTVGFTSRPGLVFDNRTDFGFPFTLGSLRGIRAGDITGTLSNQVPPPGVVGAHFYTLTIDIPSGALTGGDGFNFGIDRDESDSFGPNGTGAGNSADLLGANVLIPAGIIAPGGMTFRGMTSNGPFAGVFVNRIGHGYSVLDGFGFVNAEEAVSEPLD